MLNLLYKCYGNEARYEGDTCYAENSLPYPSWGDTPNFNAAFKSFQIFFPHDNYDFQKLDNKNADPLPGYKNAPESVRCEIRYNTLDEAKVACNENPYCNSITKDNGLCSGKKFELRAGKVSNWDGMTTYQKVDKGCNANFPYRTKLDEHEIYDHKYCYNTTNCSRKSTRANYDNDILSEGSYCSRSTWKVYLNHKNLLVILHLVKQPIMNIVLLFQVMMHVNQMEKMIDVFLLIL